MEQRREPRFDIDQSVTITNLDQPVPPLAGYIANFSANGTRLILQREMAVGTMVKVEWGTTILLGEIIYCIKSGDEYAVGLKLEDALYEKEMILSIGQMWCAESTQTKQ